MVVAVIAIWWALATWTAERTPGQQLSGLDPRSQQQQLMAQARAIQFQAPGEASELYAQVLEREPDNVEALTYRGWTLALDAVQRGGGSDAAVVPQLREAVDSLLQATDLDPTYPDPKCFLGIVNLRMLRQAAAAQPWVEACLAANPPADIRDLVQGMNDEIAAELDQANSTTVP
jgi:hypothetical protein